MTKSVMSHDDFIRAEALIKDRHLKAKNNKLFWSREAADIMKELNTLYDKQFGRLF